jgi:hypothetical protein
MSPSAMTDEELLRELWHAASQWLSDTQLKLLVELIRRYNGRKS